MVYKLSQPQALPSSSTLLAISLIISTILCLNQFQTRVGRVGHTARRENEDNCVMTQV